MAQGRFEDDLSTVTTGHYLQARVDQVVGVDIAATSIEQCKDRWPDILRFALGVGL